MPTFYKWGSGLHPDHPTIVDAYDEYLVTDTGAEIVDAAAGAAVVNLGHSLSGVGEVMAEQAGTVGYVSTSYFTIDAIEHLTRELERLTPPGLNAMFYVNSGSEANESAIKLARAYHAATGNPSKTRIVSRWQSYHGATLGALAASGNTSRRSSYEPLLSEVTHVGPAYPYRWEYTGTPAEQGRRAARELETAIRQMGPETVAAFFAEPISGSSIPAAHPHPAYYEEVRRICDEYDVLFVADEVMTGFGRTGRAFGMDHYDVVPDVMTLGKGLSAGYAPISAMAVHDRIARVFDNDPAADDTEDGSAPAAFEHGHTYSGHPVAAAVAAHVVDHYTEARFETVRERGRTLRAALEPLESHPIVGDLRSIGLMVGIEFVRDRETKAPFDPDERVHKRVFREALDRGVYTYPGSGSVDGIAGDHLMLSPPLTIGEESIERIATAVLESVDTVASRVA